MTNWWRTALGDGRTPSLDQEAVITAPPTARRSVNAGAGTGKTSTLALRAVFLIESGAVRADQIVVVTFTKKAAAEVGARISDTLDRALANGAPLEVDASGVTCTTIHALAAAILREFAFAFGRTSAPRALSDGEAYGLFHESFKALLHGEIAVDAAVFPVAEINLDALERDLGKLALRLKNAGIEPAVFAARAHAEADRLATQEWGQLWTAGRTGRKELLPKVELTAAERVCEAQREHRNIALVHALLEDFDRRLAQRNAATYGDLIGETTRCLQQHPAIVRRLRARWRYVLLDESQDTSDLQLAFLETLFGRPDAADAAGMMPVGDARQAIYSFNGADEAVMERLAAAAAQTYPLVVNRRSFQEIVDAGHAVLSAAGIVDASTPALVAAASAGGFTCVRVENFGVAGESIKEHVALEGAAIAREIRRLLTGEPCQPSDIAILVRRRTHAAAYVRELNRHGISAALDRRSSLFATDEIRDALAWMSLLLNLTDRQAAVRVLQSPVCGLSDATMMTLAQRRDWLERFVDGRLDADLDADTCGRIATVSALLAELLPAVALSAPAAVERILAAVPLAAAYTGLGETIGAQAVCNLRGFATLAQSFSEEHPGARLRDFVEDVRRRILYDDEPQEPELDVDGVRVLTIHQAKGLEWPFVFVACSTKSQYGTTGPTDSVVKYDLSTGAFGLKNDVDGRETLRWIMLGCEHDPATGERTVPAARKRAAEREAARVFYVALTRAKRRVYITVPAPLDSRDTVAHVGAVRAWGASIDPAADLAFDAPAVNEPQPVAVANVAAAQSRRLVARSAAFHERPRATQRPRLSFTALSTFETCPRLARYRYRLHLPDLRTASPRFVGLASPDAAVPANAARLGSLTHRALEFWGRARIGAQPITVAVAVSAAAPEFTDASDTDIELARTFASHAVAALESYTLVEVEAPFDLTVGVTRVEGVIDLIARAPDGGIVVVDYKTGRTDDAHYALQLTLYRRVAARRYPDTRVDAAILRLAADGATLRFGAEMSDAKLEATLATAGSLESDTARVGVWCGTCAYRDSPCRAPFAAGFTESN